MTNDFRSTQVFNTDLIVGTELYDYDKDPNETINVVDEKEFLERLKHTRMTYYIWCVKRRPDNLFAGEVTLIERKIKYQTNRHI